VKGNMKQEKIRDKLSVMVSHTVMVDLAETRGKCSMPYLTNQLIMAG
jgi:hypothetical protein